MSELQLDDIMTQLQNRGFKQKAIVSDDEMKQMCVAFDAQKGVVSTPEAELRYIEGLMDLPIGYIPEFKVLPAEGHEKCECGRVPSALDLVSTALKHKIHDKSLMRDTFIGFHNLVEMAQTGRAGECIACGRPTLFAGYRKQDYMYA